MKVLLARVNRLAGLMAVMLLLVSTGAAQPSAEQDLVSRVDEYLNNLAKQNRFSGSILIARDGRTLLSKGYGMANFEDETPNTPQTKFRLGSITKQFTAVAIMMLQERGKLSVQDSVCKYVPECPAAWQPVTIHHLLTHTSGIWSFTNTPEYRKTMALPSSPAETVARQTRPTRRRKMMVAAISTRSSSKRSSVGLRQREAARKVCDDARGLRPMTV